MIPRVSKLRQLFVVLDIGQHNTLVISIISEIRKMLLIYIFAEYDRSSPIKNYTDRLNLEELQVDDISVKFTAENTKKNVSVR